MEAFTLKGVWWLPENPDHKVEGNLSFDPGGRSKLEIFGTFQTGKIQAYTEYVFPKRVSVILGEDDAGQEITLVDSDERFGLFFGRDSRKYAAYRPRFIVRGIHLKTQEDFAFSQLTVAYYGLQVWADPRRQAGSRNPMPIMNGEKPINGISVSTGDFTVRIRREFPRDAQPEEDTETQIAFVDFLIDEPQMFDVFEEMTIGFQMFLSLAMRISTWPTLVQTLHPYEENKNVSIHFAPVTEFRKANNLTSANMYFTLEDSLPYLERGLQNWFKKSDLLSNVLQMYNWAISRELFIQEHFMIFARAVEVIHRQMHDITYEDEANFDSIREILKASIPEGTDERLRQGIVNSLQHANNPSLRGRLKDIKNRHQQCSGRLFVKYSPFVNDVVCTRNYLTHFDENDKKCAKLEPEDLYKMRERLRILLEVCLLSELGLDDSELQQIIYWNVETLIM